MAELTTKKRNAEPKSDFGLPDEKLGRSLVESVDGAELYTMKTPMDAEDVNLRRGAGYDSACVFGAARSGDQERHRLRHRIAAGAIR